LQLGAVAVNPSDAGAQLFDLALGGESVRNVASELLRLLGVRALGKTRSVRALGPGRQPPPPGIFDRSQLFVGGTQLGLCVVKRLLVPGGEGGDSFVALDQSLGKLDELHETCHLGHGEVRRKMPAHPGLGLLELSSEHDREVAGVIRSAGSYLRGFTRALPVTGAAE
jgi:hypothetical protein